MNWFWRFWVELCTVIGIWFIQLFIYFAVTGGDQHARFACVFTWVTAVIWTIVLNRLAFPKEDE